MKSALPIYLFGAALLHAGAVLAAAGDAAANYTITTTAGGTYAGDGGPAAAALLVQPEGVARDRQGNVYVADAGDHRIRRITSDSLIETVAGTGDAGMGGDGGPAAAAQLNSPYGIAFDADGNLYIADLGNARVRKVATDGTIQTFAGGGTIAPEANAPIAATDAQLMSPRNVVADGNGNVFISDFAAHRVYRVDRGGMLTVVAGNGTAGFSGDGAPAVEAQLSSPAGLAVDAAGILYIADSGNERIRRLMAGALWTLVTDPLSAGYLVSTPTGVALDESGNLYVSYADAAKVLRIARSGEAEEIALQAEDVVAADGALVAASGRSVVRYDLATGAVSTVAGGSDSQRSGDDGPAIAARLSGPYAVAVAGSGDVYIADMLNRRIRRVDSQGVITAAHEASTFIVEPAGLAFDPRGRLFVADRGSHRILVVDGGTVTTFAGTGTKGYNGETDAAATQFDSPHAIAFDQAGNLYVADTGNARIRKITPSGYVTTFAGGGTYTGDEEIAAVSAQFSEPRGLAFDSQGNLWVADTGTGRIRRISPEGRMTSPFAMKFSAPRAIAFGSNDVLFVAETGVNRMASVTPDGVYTVVAGTGDKGYAGDGGLAAGALLSSPMDVAALADGSVLVADFGNNRIRKLSAVVAPAPVEPQPVFVLHAANNLKQAVAPGQIVSIYGRDMGEQPTVTFDGVAAHVFYASPTQINAQVPPGLKAGTTATVMVESDDGSPGTASVELAANAPGLFVAGEGRAAAINQDGTVNSAANPIARGSIICLFGTGLAAGVKGVQVTIGMYTAEVLYAGDAPGLLGVFQVNARVPSGFVPAGDLEVVVKAGGVQSPGGVAIAVK